jgi:hypothetical protein
MHDARLAIDWLPRRVPGQTLSALQTLPVDPALTRFRGVARVQSRDPLSPWTALAMTTDTPTFDQLLRLRDGLSTLNGAMR